MYFTLIFLAVTGQQTYLGDYHNNAACQNAIREIYFAKMAPNARDNEVAKQAVDTAIQYQREYICVQKYKG